MYYFTNNNLQKKIIQRSFPSLSISSNMKSISSSLVAGLDKMLLKIEMNIAFEKKPNYFQ